MKRHDEHSSILPLVVLARVRALANSNKSKKRKNCARKSEKINENVAKREEVQRITNNNNNNSDGFGDNNNSNQQKN